MTSSSSSDPRPVGRTPPPARPVAEPQGLNLSLGDVYYTLFRHKWKILVCGLLGIAAAGAFYAYRPKAYQSEAKLLIRYVMESRTPAPGGGEENVKTPDQGGQSIISSELDIMTSLDLLGQVVDAVGVEKLLEPVGDGLDRDRAINVLAKSLTAGAPPRSSVITLAFTHSDPKIVQPVLRQIIDRYLRKHVEIHRAPGMVGDFITQETDQMRTRLSQTEEELRKVRAKAGVVSLEDAKKGFADRIARLRQDILDAEAQIAERSATIEEISGMTLDPKDAAAPSDLPGSDVIEEYARLSTRYDVLRRTEQELLVQFTEGSNRVREIRAQLNDAESAKKVLEREYPALRTVRKPQPAQTGAPAGSIDVAAESGRLKATQAKIKVLRAQLEETRAEAASLDQVESTIVELQRRKALEEDNYTRYAKSLDKARIEEALSAGNVRNISEIQTPSPPLKAKSKNLQIIAGLLIGGFAVGIGWSFANDLLLDQTIKRPADFERKLRIPLFLSIPVVDQQYQRRLAKATGQKLLGGPGAGHAATSSTELAVPAEEQALQPFYATLRDRLVGYFENQGLTHKPKLVAVTGLSHNSGVTSTAAGLAQSLSETGEGNVLLVDMTAEQGSAQQFFKGKAVTELDQLLETKNRAPVQENLYVVTEGSNSDRLSRNLPARFTKLVPKLKASDFDYIIFDMPNVSQVSITPRLAGFMDMVLLVIESEKTDSAIVERATALLAESKAHVGAVLNKTKNYVPRALHQDTLSDL